MNKAAEPVNAGKINSIMEGTSIEGEITVRQQHPHRWPGEGHDQCARPPDRGTSGVVEGDVTCQSSDIEGR